MKGIQILALLLCFTSADAATTTNTPLNNDPKNALNTDNNATEDFTYQGKPISVFCIDRLLNNAVEAANNNSKNQDKKAAAPVTIELAECSKPPKDYKIEKPDEDMVKKGYVGVEFQYTDVPTGGYAYYKNLGMTKGVYVIDYQFSGGGSGLFTNLLLIKREGDKLIFDDLIASGDRCNAGLAKAELKDNKVAFSLYITPFDYVDLSDENTNNLQAYDDLAACAACCLGTANMAYDFEKTNLISVDFGEPVKESEALTQGRYQSCFNKKVMEAQQQGKQVLSPSELNEFIKSFNVECVKPKSS